jgi:hypothetical protein
MQRDPIRVPALDPPDDCPRDLRPRRKVILGPSTLSTKRPNTEPEANDIHVAEDDRPALPAAYARFQTDPPLDRRATNE